MAGATDGVVVLPPDEPHQGYSVLPSLTVISSGFRPNVSAVTVAIYVLVPQPMSWVPHTASTLPSLWSLISADVPGLPVPHHIWLAIPSPRLTLLFPWPGFLFLLFQPIFSAPNV